MVLQSQFTRCLLLFIIIKESRSSYKGLHTGPLTNNTKTSRSPHSCASYVILCPRHVRVFPSAKGFQSWINTFSLYLMFCNFQIKAGAKNVYTRLHQACIQKSEKLKRAINEKAETFLNVVYHSFPVLSFSLYHKISTFPRERKR